MSSSNLSPLVQPLAMTFRGRAMTEPKVATPRGLEADAREALEGVSRAFAVSAGAVIGRGKHWRPLQARFCLYVILRNMGYSLKEIASATGRTHGAVHNGMQRFRERVRSERDLSKSLSELREEGYTI